MDQVVSLRDLLIGMALGGVLAIIIATQQTPQPVPPAPAPRVIKPTEVGRFQIVNGTPQYAQNIMLVDTVSGDTWIKCASPETGDLWCKVNRSDSETSPKK